MPLKRKKVIILIDLSKYNWFNTNIIYSIKKNKHVSYKNIFRKNNIAHQIYYSVYRNTIWFI